MPHFSENQKREILLNQARKRLFARFDDALHLCNFGQAPLHEPALAKIIVEALHKFPEQEFKVLTYAILPNHLHLLLQFQSPVPNDLPLEEFDQIAFKPLRDFVGQFQNATGPALKNALQHLGEYLDSDTFQKQNSKGSLETEGEFWHKRSFDFQIHTVAEFEKVVRFMRQKSDPAAEAADT